MNRKTLFFIAAVPVFAGYLTGVGAIFFGNPDLSPTVTFLEESVSQSWGQAFLAGPTFVLGALFCGLFLFGWLTVFPLVFYKAFGLGYSAGLFFAAFGWKGILPVGLCLFPSAAVECLLLVQASREAFGQSWALFRGWKGDSAEFFGKLKAYLLRGVVLVQCSAFVMLWDLFLSPVILSIFRDLL